MGNLFSRTEEVDEPPIFPNTPICIVYSYIGTGFHGLQYSQSYVCIENFLFNSLISAKLIPKDVLSHLGRIRWSQASRTDSGVHAAAQILSCLVSIPKGYKVRDIPDLINSKIDKKCPVHIWAALCPDRRFQAQRFADQRRYKYLMPLKALSANLEVLRAEVLPLFVGKHLYHNYTKRKSAETQSAWRTITELSVSDPFEIEGVEFVLWTISGLSFMLNQIRKMLATIVACSRGLLTKEQVESTLSYEKWCLAKAPGDGLFLDKVIYTSYGTKPGGNKNDPKKDTEFTLYRPQIEEWERDVLLPHIANLMIKNDIYGVWIKNVLEQYPPVLQSDPRAQHRKDML